MLLKKTPSARGRTTKVARTAHESHYFKRFRADLSAVLTKRLRGFTAQITPSTLPLLFSSFGKRLANRCFHIYYITIFPACQSHYQKNIRRCFKNNRLFRLSRAKFVEFCRKMSLFVERRFLWSLGLTKQKKRAKLYENKGAINVGMRRNMNGSAAICCYYGKESEFFGFAFSAGYDIFIEK